MLLSDTEALPQFTAEEVLFDKTLALIAFQKCPYISESLL